MSRSYQQYCPLARAMDAVGDRWTMLILRELFFAPKRFTDVETRLDGIAPNLLSRRLKELEARGLIARRRLDPPANATVYEITERARGLQTAMLELSRWGIQFLGPYDGEDKFSIEWLVPMLEEMADREAARGVWDVYQFVIGGESLWVEVADGDVTVRAGEPPRAPDLRGEMDEETFMAIGFGTLDPVDALAQGRAVAEGDLTKTPTALAILSPAMIFGKAATEAGAPAL
ncbi:MAG TPA: winged helix-turn-helix transcriptional regulator [Actinomycetota bacterium]|nr:winged helix-turn-helix transcriptional regulator [Actinomycetota bacterium]